MFREIVRRVGEEYERHMFGTLTKRERGAFERLQAMPPYTDGLIEKALLGESGSFSEFSGKRILVAGAVTPAFIEKLTKSDASVTVLDAVDASERRQFGRSKDRTFDIVISADFLSRKRNGGSRDRSLRDVFKYVDRAAGGMVVFVEQNSKGASSGKLFGNLVGTFRYFQNTLSGRRVYDLSYGRKLGGVVDRIAARKPDAQVEHSVHQPSQQQYLGEMHAALADQSCRIQSDIQASGSGEKSRRSSRADSFRRKAMDDLRDTRLAIVREFARSEKHPAHLAKMTVPTYHTSVVTFTPREAESLVERGKKFLRHVQIRRKPEASSDVDLREQRITQIIESDLAYQDAELPENIKRSKLEWTKALPNAGRYAESLLELARTHGLESSGERTGLRETALGLVARMNEEAERLGISISPEGRSRSWAMWDIAKQYYFFSHPDERDPTYTADNPMTNVAKRQEIIDRHLGWEAYVAYQADRTAAWVGGLPREALALLGTKPKKNGTLSSSDLAKLGAFLTTEASIIDEAA